MKYGLDSTKEFEEFLRERYVAGQITFMCSGLINMLCAVKAIECRMPVAVLLSVSLAERWLQCPERVIFTARQHSLLC